jgi:hypothetical protein
LRVVSCVRISLLGFALLGCGRDAPGPAPEPGETRDAAASATRWLECTESVRAPMEAALLAKYRLEKTDERIDGLRCVTIQLGPQPAFFVELIAAEGEKHRRLLGAIATDGTTELVGLRDGRLEWAQLRGGKVWFETLDLDGDRSDEVIVHYDDLRQDAASWIDVIALRGRSLTEIVGPRVSYDDPDLDDDVCHGVLSTERAGTATHLVVTTTASTGKSDHCLPMGRHVFALDADRLVPL